MAPPFRDLNDIHETTRKLGAGGLAYIIYENDEVKSPIAKFLQPEELAKIKEATGAKDGDAVFFCSDDRAKVNKVLATPHCLCRSFQPQG